MWSAKDPTEKIGHISKELSLPNYAHTTLSQNLWLFNTQSRVPQADWLILENNVKANCERQCVNGH